MYQFKGTVEGMDFQGDAFENEDAAYDSAISMVAEAMGWSFDFAADQITLTRYLNGTEV